MPDLETSELNQNAVLQLAAGSEPKYDDYGRIKTGANTAIKVRWETGTFESLDSQGNVIAFKSRAFVDRTIAVGSIMWLGKLADFGSPYTDLMQVVSYKETPDIKNNVSRRMVGLQRFTDSPPS